MATPEPTVDPAVDTDLATVALESGVLALALTVALVGVLAWSLLRAANKQPTAMVVVSLSLLALISLLGYAIGGEARPELAAIAGTAVGALAGATTSLLGGRRLEEADDDG